ncbi:MAG: hypothetical protein K2N18_03665 [Clostridia bacterium]|nr:hypothetical protein [Clostridia bacterium]
MLNAAEKKRFVASEANVIASGEFTRGSVAPVCKGSHGLAGARLQNSLEISSYK